MRWGRYICADLGKLWHKTGRERTVLKLSFQGLGRMAIKNCA